MSDARPQPTGNHELLEHDVLVSSFDFGEFHMNLKESIALLEARARLIHRAALGSLAIFIVCVVSAPFLHSLDQLWIFRIWSGFGLVALFTTGVLAAIDHYKYRPARKRKQRDVIWAAIEQLQLDVAELKDKLS